MKEIRKTKEEKEKKERNSKRKGEEEIYDKHGRGRK